LYSERETCLPFGSDNDFSKLTRAYPNLLFATFEVHTAIQAKMLGHSTWANLSEKSLSDPNGKQVSLSEYKLQGYHKQLLVSHKAKMDPTRISKLNDQVASNNKSSSRRNSASNDGSTTMGTGTAVGPGSNRPRNQQSSQKQQPPQQQQQHAWGSSGNISSGDIQAFEVSGKSEFQTSRQAGNAQQFVASSKSPPPRSNQIYPSSTPTTQVPLSPALQNLPANRNKQLQPISQTTNGINTTSMSSSSTVSESASASASSKIPTRSTNSQNNAYKEQPISSPAVETELWSGAGKRLPARLIVPKKSTKEKALIVEDFDDNFY